MRPPAKRQKQRLKFALYDLLFNMRPGKWTDNEVWLLFYLGRDEEVMAARASRARRDYADMNRRAKRKRKVAKR